MEGPGLWPGAFTYGQGRPVRPPRRSRLEQGELRRLGASLARLAVRREAVRRQRLVGVLVERADLQDAARFLAVGDLAAALPRNAHELLDLRHRADLGLAVLRPEVVLVAAAHMQA